MLSTSSGKYHDSLDRKKLNALKEEFINSLDFSNAGLHGDIQKLVLETNAAFERLLAFVDTIVIRIEKLEDFLESKGYNDEQVTKAIEALRNHLRVIAHDI